MLPWASSTAGYVKFSEAMSSTWPCWRRSSPAMAEWISGSSKLSGAVFSMGENANARPNGPGGKTFSRHPAAGPLTPRECPGLQLREVGYDGGYGRHHLVPAGLVGRQVQPVGI